MIFSRMEQRIKTLLIRKNKIAFTCVVLFSLHGILGCSSQYGIKESDEVIVSGMNTSAYMYLRSSIMQKRIRNSYGRYITLSGRTRIFYPGKPEKVVKGRPPSLNCNNSGNYNYNYNYSHGNYNNNSTCVIDEGTPDRVIPGEPARWANEWFDYLLDCQDKTFDRKNDGIGWQRLIEDPVAVEINREYCTAINTLPKDPRGNKW